MTKSLEEARQIFPPVWTVYANPRDYPGEIIVRLWWGLTPEPEVMRCANITEARERIALAGGSMRLQPGPADDPCIAETWV